MLTLKLAVAVLPLLSVAVHLTVVIPSGKTDGEYDAYTAEITERKKAAEDELAKLEDARRYAEYLDEMPPLVEDYLRELPEIIDHMPRIREHVLDENRTPVYVPTKSAKSYKIEVVVPGMHRKRTPKEMEELRGEAERERAGRYRRAYEMLNLKVVDYPGGTLEIFWTGGSCKLSGTRW